MKTDTTPTPAGDERATGEHLTNDHHLGVAPNFVDGQVKTYRETKCPECGGFGVYVLELFKTIEPCSCDCGVLREEVSASDVLSPALIRAVDALIAKWDEDVEYDPFCDERVMPDELVDAIKTARAAASGPDGTVSDE